MKPVIRAERLTRYFGSRAVVRDLDLEVAHGKVTALLGLNGAGKTTTIRMLVGLLWPTRGRCWSLGRDSRDLRAEDLSRIGYMVEGHYLYPWMRVGEVQRFAAEGHPRWDSLRFDSVVRHFGIERTQRVGELSRGQRAGVCLASTLAADPEVMILDDPALGLDPVSRRALNETLVEFASDNGRTVLLSSHLIDDVERVADRVAVMAEGRLMVDTTLDDFRRRVSRWSLRFDGGESIALTGIAGLASVPGLIEAHQRRDLSRNATAWWTGLGALFGVGTALAILASYPRLTWAPCDHCGKPARVDSDRCHCGALWEPPPPTGIEILESDSRSMPAMAGNG